MAAYISGYLNGPDVAGFGFNTQSAMFYQSMHAQLDVHEGVRCDGCMMEPVRGIRWKCQSCPDHDICNNCKKAGNSPGHPFEIISMTTTNNLNAAANGQQQVPEAGVHWTTCKGCSAYPIRGTMYACRICPDFDLCQNCNTQRMNSGAHQHYFEFFYMPRACNPPPQVAGGTAQHQPVQEPDQPAVQQSQPQVIKLQSATSQQQAVYMIIQQPAATTTTVTEPNPPEETWTPPAPQEHPFIPRGGSSDAYYHESAYAPKNIGHRPRPTATALQTYLAQDEDELSFPEGGQVLITGFPSEGWWQGEWKGLVGLFPASLVELNDIENHAACEGYWI